MVDMSNQIHFSLQAGETVSRSTKWELSRANLAKVIMNNLNSRIPQNLHYVSKDFEKNTLLIIYS